MSVSSMIEDRGVDMQLQVQTTAPDNGGFQVPTFTTRETVKAFLQPRSGSEGVRYGRESNREFGVGYMLAKVKVTETCRLNWNNRLFDVQNMHRPDERTPGQSLAYIRFEYEETDPDPEI